MSEEATLDEFTDDDSSESKYEIVETPIGKLPSEWKVEWLDDICEINPDGFAEDDWNSETFEYISLSNVSEGNILQSVTTPIEEAPSRAQRQIKKGDVLVGTVRPKQVSHGFVTAEHDGKICSSGFGVLRTSAEIHPNYLIQEILSHRFFRQMEAYVAGSGYPAVKIGDLEKHRISVPPLEEQRKIASVLYNVDNAIQKINEIIDQIDTVRKGLVQDLLTGKLSKGEKTTRKIGPKQVELPNTWTVRRVSDISEIKNGNRIVKGHEYADSPTEYPFIRIVDMENGTVSTDNINHLKEETAKQMQRGIITSDDVYITVTGRVGDAGTIPPELDGARFTDNAAKLYDLDGVIPEYLSLYLRSKFGQDEVHRFTVGSTQPKLSMYRVEKMEVVVPPVDKQKEIVEYISSIDETRNQNLKMRDKFQRVKQGLVQDLLSGRVRTHNKDIEVLPEVAKYD